MPEEGGKAGRDGGKGGGRDGGGESQMSHSCPMTDMNRNANVVNAIMFLFTLASTKKNFVDEMVLYSDER